MQLETLSGFCGPPLSGIEGKKHLASSAVFAASGQVVGQATWIAVLELAFQVSA